MPIINEQKYSCEPCIRGHRATSCKHSDRLMVLVRKPGRPTQGCGHTFQTCYCRSFENIFSIGGVEESVPITTSLKSKLGVRKNKSKAPKGRSFQFQEVQGGLKRTTLSPSVSLPTLEHRKTDISNVSSEHMKTSVSKARPRGRCIHPPRKASASLSSSSSPANTNRNPNTCIRTPELQSATSNFLPPITSLLTHIQNQTRQPSHLSNSFPRHRAHHTPLPIPFSLPEHLLQHRFRAETLGYIDPSKSSLIENTMMSSDPSGIPKSTNSHVGRSVMDSMNVKTQYVAVMKDEK
ncbi:hypothetical protein MFRU_022g00510 [Monilinia fructicola]|nr:hypothetical protein MFRU_022g00510 [Monilinia fructicola]